MRRASLLILLLAACGGEPDAAPTGDGGADAPPAPPPRPVVDPLPTVRESWTRELGAGPAAVLRVESRAQFDHALGWLLSFGNLPLDDLGIDFPSDASFGLGLFLDDEGAQGLQWVVPGSSVPEALRRSPANADWDLPRGTLGGRVDLTRLAPLLRRPASPGVVPWARLLLAPLAPLESCRWTFGESGDDLRLDLRLGDLTATHEPGRSLEMLRHLPREPMVLLFLGPEAVRAARHVDEQLGADAATPVAAPLAALLGPSAPVGEGAVVGYDLSDRGLEIVVVSDAIDAARVRDAFAPALEALTPTRWYDPMTKVVEGCAVVELRGEIVLPEVPPVESLPPEAGAPFQVLRAVGEAPQGVDDDAAVLAAALERGRISVESDSRCIYLQEDPFGLGDTEDSVKIVQMVVWGRDHVSFRRTVPPDDPDLAALRKTLDADGESGQRAAATRRFPRGLTWLRSIAGEWVLALDDEPDLRIADLAWAHVSAARLGPLAATRDISFRLFVEAAPRWHAARKQTGVALLVDGIPVSVLPPRTGEPAVVGDWPDVPEKVADLVIPALGGPRLENTYEYAGVTTWDGAHREDMQAQLREYLAPQGLRLTIGAVGARTFIVLSADDAFVRQAVLAVRDGRPIPPRAQEALQQAGGQADFLLQVDLGALVCEFRRWGSVRPPATRSAEERKFFEDLRGMGRGFLTVRGIGSGLRVLAQVDGSVKRWCETGQREVQRRNAEDNMAELAAWAARWESERLAAGETARAPTSDELPGFRRVDPWGTAYRVRRTDAGFEVECAGPDHEFGTADDCHARQR